MRRPAGSGLILWLCRWGKLALPALALGGCVSDLVYRSFLVGQVQATLVDVLAIAVNAFVASLFPNSAVS